MVISEAPRNLAGQTEKIFRIYSDMAVTTLRQLGTGNRILTSLTMSTAPTTRCPPAPTPSPGRYSRIHSSAHRDRFGSGIGSEDTSQSMPNACTRPESNARVIRIFGAGHAHPLWRIKYILRILGVPMPMPMPSAAHAPCWCAL